MLFLQAEISKLKVNLCDLDNYNDTVEQEKISNCI